MSRIPGDPGSTPPNLGELFQRYLSQQVSAQAAGLGFADVSGEVSLHEAAPAQPVEPRLAWNETLLVLQQFQPRCSSLVVPPDWSSLVAMHEPIMALTFSTGNYPQLVRNLQPLIQTRRLSDLRTPSARVLDVSALAEWARLTARKGKFPETLLALGTLRLMRQFKGADELIKQQQGAVPAEWQAAWENERAALTWEQGEAEEAAKMWQDQADRTPVVFNRGMAALFLDRSADARTSLNQVITRIPERSGWHHLAKLYQALAEMRSA